jgi:hypothetical protein
VKIFVHEQSRVIRKHCSQSTLYPVNGLYCSVVCRDHFEWWTWWRRIGKRLSFRVAYARAC